MAAPHELLGHKLRVTASVGVAVYPIDGANADTLLKSADAAMYQTKVNGGNGYWFSSQGMPAATARPDSARFG